MDAQFIGESAAITVSFFWTLCSILFAIAGKKVGALSVNGIRIVMAIGLLGGMHIILLGTIVPAANMDQWFYMGLSGIIGLGLGDLGYFACLVILGPRRGVLIMATNPIFSAVVGYAFLGEILGPWAIVGIGVTLIGVIWVIMESEEDGHEEIIDKKRRMMGIVMGIIGSAGQGVGLVISKYGMFNAATDPTEPLAPLSATLIRMIVAAIFVWITVALMNRMPEILRATKDRRAILIILAGAIFGPFLGVWLSMISVTYTFTGVAATLMSLMPVMVIPVVWVLDGHRTSWRGFIGATVAIVGVAILFLF